MSGPLPSACASALSRLPDLRVIVLGDVMLDIYDFCQSSQSKPIDSEKPGKRAYHAHESVTHLGGAGNVATNVCGLGAKATLVGVAGNDGHWHTMRTQCEQSGIRHCLVRDARRPTTTKTRVYIDDDYLLRKDHESTAPIDRETAITLANEVALLLAEGADALILSDYAKGLFTPDLATRVHDLAAERGIPVVVDFKPSNREIFHGRGLLVPNESEAAALLPGFRDARDLEHATRGLADALGVANVVVTLGARGICGLDDGSGFFHIAGHEVTPVDAVGCGDTVRAVLALGLAAGLTLPDAAALANAAAAVIVQKPATATLTREELAAFLAKRGP